MKQTITPKAFIARTLLCAAADLNGSLVRWRDSIPWTEEYVQAAESTLDEIKKSVRELQKLPE